MGLSAALATAGRSLEVFSAGIQVAGQNVSNANTPGFIREELNLTTDVPFRQGELVFGSGVRAAGITQQIDKFLEVRIHAANTELHASQAREQIFKQLETELRELGEGDLSTSFSRFLATVQDVVNQPELPASRQFVLEQGEQFAADVVNLRTRVNNLRTQQTVAVDSLVQEANRLIRKIDELNPQIVRLESSGLIKSEAGGLRTQRFEALNRLSEIVPIQFRERDNGSVDVFTSNDFLIIGGTTQTLETFSEVNRGVQVQSVRLSTTKSELSQNATGGELKGIIDGRDNVLGGFVDQLDQFAATVTREFNRIHTSGEGLIGYDSITSETAVLDEAAPLTSSTTGLAFVAQHGSFELKVRNRITGLTETTTIPVDLDGIGSDTSFEDLQSAIDGVDNVSAAILPNGTLQIDADANFEVRFANDTSGVLAALGLNTFFSGSDSATIALNSALAADHRLLATGQGGGASDSRNAVQLAEFDRMSLPELKGDTITEFYERVVSEVGQKSASETSIADGLRDFHESLKNQREQFSGVSLDEEAIKILNFQHGFQAAARLISTIDELLTTLTAL